MSDDTKRNSITNSKEPAISKEQATPQKQKELDYSLDDGTPSDKSAFWAYLFLLVVLILLILGGGYYFLHQPSGQALLHKTQNTLGIQQTTMESPQTQYTSEDAKDDEIKRLQEALYQKNRELEHLAQSVEGLNVSVQEMQEKKAQNTMTKLRYSIKPKRQIITECFSMEIGKWEIPQSCLLSIATKVDSELQNDKRVVAFEVQGIVDTNPYRGLSPELKQEGLASFRAWEAIRSITSKIPNAVVFEGPSLQLENKRGYSIKAYFVE